MHGEATTNVGEGNLADAIEAAEIRAARRRRLLIGFWIVSSIIELYFVTKYLTWVEFWRLSGKGMAVGLGFAVALFGVIEVFAAVRTARARRNAAKMREQWEGAVARGASVTVADNASADPQERLRWHCSQCQQNGIGGFSAFAHHTCTGPTSAA